LLARTKLDRNRSLKSEHQALTGAGHDGENVCPLFISIQFGAKGPVVKARQKPALLTNWIEGL